MVVAEACGGVTPASRSPHGETEEHRERRRVWEWQAGLLAPRAGERLAGTHQAGAGWPGLPRKDMEPWSRAEVMACRMQEEGWAGLDWHRGRS